MGWDQTPEGGNEAQPGHAHPAVVLGGAVDLSSEGSAGRSGVSLDLSQSD